MYPYESSEAHVADILRLAGMRNATASERNAHYKRIMERESITTAIFLPALRLRTIFHVPNPADFYMLIARTLTHGEPETGKLETGEPGTGKLETGEPETGKLETGELETGGLNIDSITDDAYYDAHYDAYYDESWQLIDKQTGLLHKRIVQFLLQPDKADERPWMTVYYAQTFEDGQTLDDATQDALHKLAATFLSENAPHILFLHGKRGVGRKTRAAHALGNAGLLLVDAAQLATHPDFLQATQDIVLESRLTGLPLCIENAGYLLGDEAKRNAWLYTVKPVSKIIFFIDEQPPSDFDRRDYTLAEIHIPLPEPESAVQIWQHTAAAYEFIGRPDFVDMANRYVLTPLQIRQNLERAYHHAVAFGDGRISEELLYTACRESLAQRHPLLGSPVVTGYTEADLILPEPVKAVMDAVVSRMRCKSRMLHAWGFARKTPYGGGVSVLMEGFPGSGKTMAAQVLSNRLGLPLYRVDLSAVVSKYIGETEKNLRVVFDEARASDGILFFDEADALFGKRTEVTDAKDRYANVEIAFLLQKLEEHSGLSILATNLSQNIDDAFKRRFHYIVRLPFPDETLRRRIWNVSIPPQTPVSDDIDWDYLAGFRLNGSSIKNIVLSAAYTAFAQNDKLRMKYLLAAVQEEHEKSGTPMLM